MIGGATSITEESKADQSSSSILIKLLCKISSSFNILKYYGYLDQSYELEMMLCKNTRAFWRNSFIFLSCEVFKDLTVNKEFSKAHSDHLLKHHRYCVYNIGVILNCEEAQKQFIKFHETAKYKEALVLKSAIVEQVKDTELLQKVFDVLQELKISQEYIKSTLSDPNITDKMPFLSSVNSLSTALLCKSAYSIKITSKSDWLEEVSIPIQKADIQFCSIDDFDELSTFKLKEEFVSSVKHVRIIDKGVLSKTDWQSVSQSILTTFPYYNYLELETKYNNQDEMCFLLNQILVTNTPNIIKFNSNLKIDVGKVKVKNNSSPAVVFIRENKTSEFICIVCEEVDLSWAKTDEILYYNKNDLFVINNLVSVAFKKIIKEQPSPQLVKRMKSILEQNKICDKSDFLLIVQNIAEFSCKQITKFIQPLHKITINITNSQQVKAMLNHSDYSSWISQLSYIKVNIISCDDELMIIKFLESLSEKRVLSLVLHIKISDDVLSKLIDVMDTLPYLSSLNLKVHSEKHFKKILDYLDCTQSCTMLESHQNLTKDEQKCECFRKTLKSGEISCILNTYDYTNSFSYDKEENFDYEYYKTKYKNLFSIRPYMKIVKEKKFIKSSADFVENMWTSSSLIPNF